VKLQIFGLWYDVDEIMVLIKRRGHKRKGRKVIKRQRMSSRCFERTRITITGRRTFCLSERRGVTRGVYEGRRFGVIGVMVRRANQWAEKRKVKSGREVKVVGRGRQQTALHTSVLKARYFSS
jgi:hypothetical protein